MYIYMCVCVCVCVLFQSNNYATVIVWRRQCQANVVLFKNWHNCQLRLKLSHKIKLAIFGLLSGNYEEIKVY